MTPESPRAETPTIVSDDEGLLVVDKPAGWIVHPAGPTAAPVLIDWVREALGLDYVAPVHRLDVETSGIVLLASRREVAGSLGAALARKELSKQYLALVAGRTNDKGIVRVPLDDARRGRPLEAVTRYRTAERLGGFTLVRARPEHGRKHQIRRHLASVGHPVVGDSRWGPRRPMRCPGFPGRLWLHASRLELPDGRAFEAALPPELEAHLAVLRAGQRRETE